MLILADSHAHLYPSYDFGVFLARAFDGFDAREREYRARRPAASGDALRLVCLAGPPGGLAPERCTAPGFAAERGADPAAVRVRDAGGRTLWLLAGRQLVTAERLEVLALGADPGVPDGLGAHETLGRVLASEAVPVLPWGLGKWLGARGRVVAELLAGCDPARVAAGDTPLRPLGWPEPLLLRRARARGIRVLAGSDPLPPAGEAGRIASYVAAWEDDADPDRPAGALAALLRRPGSAPRRLGRRDAPWTVLRRVRAHAAALGRG
jgi:hypothetical protein